MTEHVDYAKVLADLEHRRDKIDQAITTLRGIMGVSMAAASTSVRGQAAANGSGVLKPHMFFGMSAPEAAAAYLAAVRETRTAAKIADDLIQYGWTTTSQSPSNVVRTALSRLAKEGEVVQLKGKEWGLVDWFPGLNKGKRAAPTLEKPADLSHPKRPPSRYNVFLKEKMSQGLSMKEAAAAWQVQKAKDSLPR